MTYQNQQLEFEITLDEKNKDKFIDGKKTKTITGAKSSIRIQNYGGQYSGKARIVIFGLNVDDIAILTRSGIWNTEKVLNTIRVKANGDTIYYGEVVECLSDFNSAPDIYVTIDCLNSISLVTSATKAFSQSGKVKASNIIESIIKPLNMTLINNGVNDEIDSPYIDGNSLEQIEKVCKAVGCFYSITYDSVFITKDKAREEKAIEISPDNFLIGYPMYAWAGVTIKTYFNPLYEPYGRINLKTHLPLASGEYIINSIEHNLTSNIEGGSFDSTLTLYKA